MFCVVWWLYFVMFVSMFGCLFGLRIEKYEIFLVCVCYDVYVCIGVYGSGSEKIWRW